MTPDQLRARLYAPEDSFVERKSEGIKPHDIRKAVTAFANSLPDGQHGVIFIGIGDRGAVEGCVNTDAVQKRVHDAVKDCYPPISTQSVVLQEEGKDIVALIVPASHQRPHFTGPAYIRRGSESVQASKPLFDEIVDARHSKVRAILALKDKVITVYGKGHHLGRNDTVAAGHLESAECRLVACDAHLATFNRLADSWEFYESVDRIEITRDGKMKRPALLVRGH